jgi:hypothetical protein
LEIEIKVEDKSTGHPVYGREAVRHKLKNSSKTGKKCKTQGPIHEIFMKKYWELAELENEVFTRFFESAILNFFLLHLNEKTKGFHMRYHLFLQYGWFLQNLGKDFIPTNMHTTVHHIILPWIRFWFELELLIFLSFFRLNDKQFSIWVKDSLVKQGHTTAKAETLLKSVTTTVNTFAYNLRILKQLLRSLHRIMAKRGQLVPEEKMATFFDLVVLDATAVQLHLALDKARTSNDPDLKSYIESTAEVRHVL